MLYNHLEQILIWTILVLVIILFIKKSLPWLAALIIIFIIALQLPSIKIAFLKGLIWITQKEIQTQESLKKRALKRKVWLEEKIKIIDPNSSFISKENRER